MVACLAALASGKKPAAPATSQPAANAGTGFDAAVSEAVALAITPDQLEARCLTAHKGQPDAATRCRKAHDDMAQCVTSYPGAADGASRQQCFQLRSSSS